MMAAGFDFKELQASGYTASEVLEAGGDVHSLASGGFSSKDIMAAGLGILQMQEVMGVSDLVAAGFNRSLTPASASNANAESQ